VGWRGSRQAIVGIFPQREMPPVGDIEALNTEAGMRLQIGNWLATWQCFL